MNCPPSLAVPGRWAGRVALVLAGWGGLGAAVGAPLTPLRVLGESGFHHAGSISDIVMLADGKRVLSSSQDGSARLWDLASGRELRRFLRPDSDGMWGLLLLPGEKEFLTAGDGGYVTRWELATGRQVMTYRHGSTVFRLALRDGGKEFVATDNSNVAVLWNLETGEKIRTFKGHTDSVYTAMFISEGKRLLTGASDGKLKMWDVATGKCERTYEKELDDVYTIRASPDGTRFAMCSADDRLRVFESETLKVVWSTEFENDVKVASWSPDGKEIATACEDKKLYVFDAEDGKRLKAIEVKQRYHTPLTYSLDGKELVSGDECMLHRHVIASGKRIVPEAGVPGVFEGVSALALSSERVYAAGEDPAIQVWGVGDGGDLGRHEVKSAVNSMALSPNGEVLATGDSGNGVHLRAAKSGEVLRVLESEGRAEEIVFARRGAWVIAAGSDDQAHLWDAGSGRKIRSFVGHQKDVNAVAVTPDSLTLFTASDDRTARLWEVETGREVRRFTEVKDTLHGVAVLREGPTFLLSALEPEMWGWIAPVIKKGGLRPREEVEALVAELAAEKFAQRDAATKALVEMGSGDSSRARGASSGRSGGGVPAEAGEIPDPHRGTRRAVGEAA